MLDIILICSLVFLILTFFYKQCLCDFRINQIEWAQKDNLLELLHEKIPLVIRTIPSAAFWTHEDVLHRPCFASVPVFKEMTVGEWLKTTGDDVESVVCPWTYTQAEQIAAVSGISIWAQKWMNPVVIHPFLKWWFTSQYHCWAGAVGLRKTYATWTCIFPVDGEITVTVMPESVESSLPAGWLGCFPSQLTIRDTPFVADIKYLDVVLRPGNCLFMPPHWFISWTSLASNASNKSIIPMVCTVSYHTPISYLAFHTSKK